MDDNCSVKVYSNLLPAVIQPLRLLTSGWKHLTNCISVFYFWQARVLFITYAGVSETSHSSKSSSTWFVWMCEWILSWSTHSSTFFLYCLQYVPKPPLCVFLLFRRYLCIIFQHLPSSPEPTDHVEAVTNKKAKEGEKKKVFLWISLLLSGRPDPAITVTVPSAFNTGVREAEKPQSVHVVHLTNHQ